MTRISNKEEQILSLLNGLGNKISPRFERCTGISSTRFEILHQLCQVDELNQSMLQKVLQIDGAAITRHLKQLEADGMVTRRRNPEDNRVTFVRLTEEGQARIAGYRAEKEILIQQILQHFSEEEINQLAGYLERMQNNMGEHFA
ncbi:MarR family transcriptional regulator [Paenibacillus sp. JX-17]|uniref:MarR family transcriptional regulator n=1 Tax=Paenibacillus lacisoli TaxID=3064525 RepID=A0ABT9C9Y4_9BACL|nr:MarR family transcriptional regulator [Paenibacillus sp. JX-17]MDO7906066.1 MarR family transcriptional regulator [Paenibacillus sp. JX-17]